LVERGVSVDQNIPESDDLTAIGNFGRDVRCNLRELVEGLADDSNWRSTADCRSTLAE
jgi:hypothetical protein